VPGGVVRAGEEIVLPAERDVPERRGEFPASGQQGREARFRGGSEGAERGLHVHPHPRRVVLSIERYSKGSGVWLSHADGNKPWQQALERSRR
jgi:hypothetical protein